MKTVIIANPKAAAGRVGRDWTSISRPLNSFFSTGDVRFTVGPGHATTLARLALGQGAERIVVVGGDGTINEVVNGFFTEGQTTHSAAQLCVYPVGTGGDFARSIGLSGKNPAELLERCEVRAVDVGRATLRDHHGQTVTKYFINESSVGSSGAVVHRVNNSWKGLGGKASFFIGTVQALAAYRNKSVHVRVDDSFEADLVINTLVAANGRYFGGAMKVAPDALVNDGLFDIVIIGDIGLLKFLRHSPALYKGEHVRSRDVKVLRGKTITLTPLTDDPVLIDLDGEQPGTLPVRFEIMPAALPLFAPWSLAEAVTHGTRSRKTA